MTPEEKTTLKLGIGRIPEILLDTTDRNRTSPLHSREIVLSSVPPDPQPTVLLP